MIAKLADSPRGGGCPAPTLTTSSEKKTNPPQETLEAHRARAALALYAKPRPRERPEHWPAFVWPLYFVRAAFAHNRRFGLLFLGGLAADVVIRLLPPR